MIAILGRPEDKANSLPVDQRLSVFPCSDLFNTEFGHIDTVIHTAFSRGDNLPGLTSSIDFTEKIIEMVNNDNIDSIVNISSQGVYKGLRPGEKVKENGAIGPGTSYGLAKWAVENMLKVGCRKRHTSIRMASLSTNARFLDFFVDSVANGRDICVTAPRQYASIMDVHDAVQGILSIVRLSPQQRDEIINLGPGLQYSILEYAEMANKIGEKLGFQPVTIHVEDSQKEFAICMDSDLLRKMTGWQPEVTPEMMLSKMFRRKTSRK